MRILITADLHYDIARSRQPACDLAQQAVAQGGDALVLAGDSAGADTGVLAQCLRLFADFPGRKFFVPGNHCLWCRNGETSLDRYQKILPQVAASEGFVYLDDTPAVIGRLGLAGSIGWYDYSLADESLGIPLDFYAAKTAPGAAQWLGNHQIVDAHRDKLTDEHMSLGVRWMDGQHVRLGMTDGQFVDLLVDKLSRQLDAVAPRVDRIVAVLHHLPFAQMVPRNRPPRFAFAAAFMGASRLGEVLLACPKVTHVYAGHSHWPVSIRIGHLTAENIGCTYESKRLTVLDIED